MTDPSLHNYALSLEAHFRNGDPDADGKQEELASVRVVQAAIARIGAGDFESLAELLADDVRLEIKAPDHFGFDREASGRGGVVAALRKNFGVVAEQRPRIEAVVAQGDTVVVVFRDEGRLVGTGETYEVEGMHRFVCRDGRIAFIHEIAVPS